VKKINLVAAFLLAVAVLVSLGWALRSDSEALRELDDLVKRAQVEEKLCSTAVAALQNPDFAIGTNANPVHVSHKGALAVIEVLEKMPTKFPANAAAFDYYLDHLPELSRNWHFIKARAIVGEIPGPCSTLDTFRQLRALFNDSGVYHFSPVDARRVRAVTRRYLVEEPRFHSLMEGLVKYSILVSYLKAEKSPLVARAEAASQEAEHETQALLAQNRKHKYRWLTLRGLEPEWALVARIYRSYYAILLDSEFLAMK
jgi:hypothetical protein